MREVPEETAVALVHDATTTAVMMATPQDLEFAIEKTTTYFTQSRPITTLRVPPPPSGGAISRSSA